MKKLGKALLLGAALTGVLFISGCGEEEKFKTAEGELSATVQELQKKSDSMSKYTWSESGRMSRMSEADLTERVKMYDELIPQLQTLGNTMDEKLKVMDETSKKETKLRGEYTKWASEVEYTKKLIGTNEGLQSRYKKALEELKDGTRSKKEKQAAENSPTSQRIKLLKEKGWM